MPVLVMPVLVMPVLVVGKRVVAGRVAGVMGVAVKRPFQEKHGHESGQGPAHGRVDVAVEFEGGVRQQVQHAHAQEHPAGERQQDLHRPVAEGQEGHG